MDCKTEVFYIISIKRKALARGFFHTSDCIRSMKKAFCMVFLSCRESDGRTTPKRNTATGADRLTAYKPQIDP